MDLSKHVKPLNGELDWPLWKRKIRDLLDYHEGALDVIDGKLLKPEALGSNATENEIKKHKECSDLFRKANSYAKSMLTSSLTDGVYQKVMDTETAKEMWEALRQQFEATSKDQLFKICTDFFAYSWTLGEDVSTHIAKLKSLWNELNNGLKVKNENKLPELLLVCKVLQILPDEFRTFKSSWMLLASDERKTFEELTTQLCMHERNFLSVANHKIVENEALVAKATNQKPPGSKRKFYRKWSKENDTCNYCKEKGHWLKSCKKWISDGKPAKNRLGRNTAIANVTSLMSVCEEAFMAETNSTDWWIDNGATRHVTNCSDMFINYTEFDSPHGITAAGKEILTAVGKGNIRIMSAVNGKWQEIMICDVWLVPKISRNLFSVLAAQDRNPKNSKFESTATECWLKIGDEPKLYGTRKVSGSLFKAAIRPIMPDNLNEVNVTTANNSMLQLYHERWGHQDKYHVKTLIQKNLGINIRLDRDICEPCIYGKSHRLPFGTRNKVTQPGELVSTDVCGPFDESFKKMRYLVIFKDSYTKFRYGYVIKHKSDVKDALRNMLAHAKTLGHKIKELLSDNGGEFDNGDVRLILSTEGITQKLTAPYTPEQNGGSEREMRTIVEMARTLKYSNSEVNFPAAMWAELVGTAIYILNRTGKSSVECTSPYELWIGKKPRIKHLRIIGCICYVNIPTQRRRKMDKKAIKGYLIGYDNEERYRIWVKEQNKVILSRDVIFQEKIGECIKHVELKIQDSELKNSSKQSVQEKPLPEQNNEETENNRKTQNLEQEIDETENEDESELEETITSSSSSARQLRDRSLLQKPKRFENYIMEAETIFNEIENPETFQEAINSKQNISWKTAMNSEIASLKENQTWVLVPLPEGAKAIPCKWVFRVKTNPDGSVDKYKARLVVKGFSQRQGIDYSQTFSPVARLGTIRAMLSIAANEKLNLTQFDVSTAFLYGELEEDIYMRQPEGFNDGTNRVCKLKRSLYGLKQAPRCWNKRFGGFLLSLGFKASEADPCLYMRECKGRKLLVALYVDDGLVMATNQQDSDIFISELKTEFKITVKPASYFLGLEIKCYTDGRIHLNQEAYAKKILERFDFLDSKPAPTPILKAAETSKRGKEELKKDFPYRQAVGALMYLMVGTRPDLAYSIGFLSRSLQNPSEEDISKVKRVFRYIAGTPKQGITYQPNFKRGVLECYSDADFGGCSKTGRSTSGVVIMYAGGAISWLSQRQALVATSTTEAEIVAASEAAKEAIWLSRLYNGILTLKHVPVLQVDNRAAVKLAQNPEFHRRTKHIDMKHFFIREKVIEGTLDIEQIPTEMQVADVMTKPLARSRLLIMCDKMGMLYTKQN